MSLQSAIDLTSGAKFARVVSRAGGYRSVGQMVYDVLREAIISGSFRPGEPLPQEKLAEKVGVSRAPVRAALMQLQKEGLVDFDPRRGACVRTRSPEHFEEIYQLRRLFETYALHRSMAHMTPERQATLESLAAELDSTPCNPELLETRTAFYRAVYDSDANPLLTGLIEQLRGHIGVYLRGRHPHPDEPSEYHALIKHMSEGDLASAEEWIEDYLDQVKARVDEMSAEISAETSAEELPEAAAPPDAAALAREADVASRAAALRAVFRSAAAS